jgi:VCBS repeat-containing protein
MRWKDGSQLPFPPIENVPVITPATAFAGMKFPVRVGDKVVLHIQDRDIQRLLHTVDTSGLTPPEDKDPYTYTDTARVHDLTDCVAYTGFGSFGSLKESDFDVWIFNNDSTEAKWLDASDQRGTGGLGRFDSKSLAWTYTLLPSSFGLAVGEVVEDSYTFNATTGDIYEVPVTITGTGTVPVISCPVGEVLAAGVAGDLEPISPNESNYNHIRLKQNGDIELKTVQTTVTVGKEGTVLVDAPTEVTLNTPMLTVNGEISATGVITSAVDCISAGVSGVGHTHTGNLGYPTSAPN